MKLTFWDFIKFKSCSSVLSQKKQYSKLYQKLTKVPIREICIYTHKHVIRMYDFMNCLRVFCGWNHEWDYFLWWSTIKAQKSEKEMLQKAKAFFVYELLSNVEQ